MLKIVIYNDIYLLLQRTGVFEPVVDATTGKVTSYKGTVVPMIEYFCEDTHCT